MFLKSIEIQGFKSFPDKAVLDFGRGVTAIVGPNGSGKSNIVDAIRWVLGEQSAKAMRGGRMEDVIFGGTLRRGPLGFCEVTLVLDNTDGGIALEYGEVSITRRYYRSGESEFFINRKSVRLKDVHELFMDTGLGRDGYSIIGQGRIDEILSVKSADRREIFEEAAGITRFRYRKEESERKLAGCEDNLTRVRDIISELEGQVEPLREQAEKAKSFLLLRDELRVLEVSVWLDSLDKLKDNLQKAQTDYNNAERMLAAKKREIDELHATSSQMTEEMHERDMLGESLRDQLREVETRLSEINSRIAVSFATIKNNEDNILGQTQEISQQQGREAGLASQLQMKRESLALLNAKDADMRQKLDELMQEVLVSAGEARGITERIDALVAGIELKRQSRADLQAEAMAFEVGIREIISRGDNIKDEREIMRTRLQNEYDKLAEMKKSLEENSEKKDTCENMLRGFGMRVQAREKKLREQEENLARLTRENDAKADRIKMLSAMEREYEGFSASVRNVMQAAKHGELKYIHGPVADIIETDDHYAIAIEIALGASMQNIVVDSEKDAKAAINYLKARDMGRATFLPLSAVKNRYPRKQLDNEPGFIGWGSELVRFDSKYDVLISSLLGGTAVAQDLDYAIAMAKRNGYAFRIVTLDGQLINPSGAMTGGSLNKNTGVLSRAGEIRRLKAESETLAVRIDTLTKELRETKRELEAATYESDAAKHELRQAEDALLAIGAERAQQALLIESIEGAIAQLDGESDSQSKRIADAKAGIENCEAKLRDIAAQSAELQSALDSLSGDREKTEKYAGSLSDAAASIREELAAIRAEQDSTSAAIAEFENLLGSVSAELVGKESAINLIRERNEELRRDVEENRQIAAGYSAEAEQVEKRVRDVQSEKMQFEGARVKCDRDIQAKNAELLNLERERGRLENKKIQAEMEEDGIIQRLWENYELTRVTAQAVRVELESLSKANRRIGELKAGIKKLGDVSIASIDEYAKVSERYTYLTTQRDDLEKAQADLIKIIGELTENMKSIFAGEFEKINRMFQTTFVEIFGGGNGRLKLEDESDILNCGIEIIVELPGKAVRAISLLSGGEKAFVAIALYFSIIKVRPTPFCLLDEIEAALDNVNILRFSQYLRTMCEKTQFIVITHRRGTMEGADILYGVTMQEKGVTKLLTLNISDVEKQIQLKPN